MKHRLLVGVIALAMTAASTAQTWATATATNPEGNRVVVYRFLKQLPPGLNRASQPERFIVDWKYDGARGMPTTAERQRMDAMEDALEGGDGSGRSMTLAVVSTGNNLRRWVYYAQSERDFAARLNRVTEAMPGLPLELHSEADPEWKAYEAFKATIRE
ncbi:DUF695 domain-containing protein [Variovorax ureilyticus]|uniref:DUF695 domain-containing protein n=1 Tax=Variovorax ureilyticus TaxID=1836198 RepID=UPI003D66626B